VTSNVIAFPPKGGDDPRLTKKQLAGYLGCSTRTVENRMREGLPTVGSDRAGRVLFSLKEATAWLEKDRPPKPARDRLSLLEDRVAALERAAEHGA
jgi:phage terminase Nu1 subunit (DNA packaging protein)